MHTSLSSLIEQYLLSLTSDFSSNTFSADSLPPITQELLGWRNANEGKTHL